MIYQVDVKKAFLNRDLEEEIYIDQPKGFTMLGNEHKVCKLLKSLYGLKQAPRQWHEKFDQCLLSNGFKQMKVIDVYIIKLLMMLML